ncbi:MAG: hypothetical protein U0V73_04555 [Acidimicrobiia bacterium]
MALLDAPRSDAGPAGRPVAPSVATTPERARQVVVIPERTTGEIVTHLAVLVIVIAVTLAVGTATAISWIATSAASGR